MINVFKDSFYKGRKLITYLLLEIRNYVIGQLTKGEKIYIKLVQPPPTFLTFKIYIIYQSIYSN